MSTYSATAGAWCRVAASRRRVARTSMATLQHCSNCSRLTPDPGIAAGTPHPPDGESAGRCIAP